MPSRETVARARYRKGHAKGAGRAVSGSDLVGGTLGAGDDVIHKTGRPRILAGAEAPGSRSMREAHHSTGPGAQFLQERALDHEPSRESLTELSREKSPLSRPLFEGLMNSAGGQDCSRVCTMCIHVRMSATRC